MTAWLSPVLRVSAVVVFAAACGEESRDHPLAPPAFSHSGDHTISGNVLGPDGTTICNFLPPGTGFRVAVIDPLNATSSNSFVGFQILTCPANSFSIPVAPGTYRLWVRLGAFGIGALPLRFLNPGNAVIDGDVVQDIQVLDGIAMGGSATLDGSPFYGVPLNLHYDLASPVFEAAFGGSGSDGLWDDTVPNGPVRSPMTVQSGVRYLASGCSALGIRVLAGFPTSSFLFPTEVAALNCTLETARNVAFSHDLTRLVVTPMPGEIGGQSFELIDQFGLGWGVQFPAGTPSHLGPNHLFRGGLLVGIAPDRVLSGVDVNPYIECGAACRDFGLDGTVKFTTEGGNSQGASKTVTWRYSDAPSLDAVGLSVVQRSFDGQPPAAYVLFKFTFRNTGTSRITFYAGFFGDWDVQPDFGQNIGFTDLSRRLMYVVNNGGGGTHAGTLLLGQPISGNFFFVNPLSGSGPELSLTEALDALRGALTQTTGGPADIRYIHGAGPITLKPTKATDLWIAIVAGENKAQLLANAAAARADVADRQQ